MLTTTTTTTTTENVGRTQVKRPTSLNVSKPAGSFESKQKQTKDLIEFLELILRDSTNAGCKSEGSLINSVQKRQQKKKKRRTANSYSDISFNDKYKLTEELLGTGAHGYEFIFEKKNKRIFFVSFFRVVKTCRDRVTKQEYAVKVRRQFYILLPYILLYKG
jgi:hypothetical protein